MRLANEAFNNSPSPQDSSRRTTEQIFSKTNININAKHCKLCGCLVFVLDSALQLNNHYHKWKERGEIGIYMGKPPQHGRNISLVLDPTTVPVSTQLHVKHDSSFDVVNQQHFKSN